MLKKLFTSGSRVKLFEELIFNPKEELYLSELARATGTEPIQASKELSNLKDLGLVKERKEEKMIFYKMNKDSPIYSDLKNIFLKTESLGNSLKKYLKDHKLQYAVIFGSFAKGEEKPESDVDLLLVGNIGEKKLIKTIHKAEKNLRREINYILWSRKEFNKKLRQKHHLLKDIHKNKTINLIGGEDEFRNTLAEGLDKKD